MFSYKIFLIFLTINFFFIFCISEQRKAEAAHINEKYPTRVAVRFLWMIKTINHFLLWLVSFLYALSSSKRLITGDCGEGE